MSRRDEKSAAKAFKKSNADWRRLVVFAEGRSDYAHLGPVVERLIDHHDIPISYLTGEADDPVLDGDHPNLAAYNIGSGSVRNVLLRDLRAKMLLTTTPDFDTFAVKRSLHDVHYVYLFHAVVSTHMVYRPGAFDAFDTVLCVGPHHAREIRAAEERGGGRRRRLVKHGYGRVDALAAEAATQVPEPGVVVVAGSWGENAFMETPVGRTILERLLAADYEVIVRLHPMTKRRLPELAFELSRDYGGDGRLRVETDMRDRSSLLRSSVLISDWSGAAFDYALGMTRPVISIDTPAKVNNPHWADLGIDPIERQLRPQIGRVIDPAGLEALVPALDDLQASVADWKAALTERRDATIYNVGHSAEAAATWLAAAVR
ncbi:MAG: CDP-glycerol glycerophosphotransferase family protein [Acidimicrobiia bacterium]|nr:CDP-glycerol glycerophosphotransferase family protein [Acidimicrobiia bacterium]MDH5237136.1 CDP-glycerol glycerophosphotransferase family protein [Acidimicrobiia bacterium]